MGSEKSAPSNDHQQPQNVMPGKGNTGEWKMPEPKFQQTSGYLPKGYAAAVMKKFSPDTVKDNPSGNTEQQQELHQDVSQVVEPQPDIYEQINAGQPPTFELTEAEPQEDKSEGNWKYVFLGIGLMFIALALFIFIVYVLFLAPAGNHGPF